MEKVVIIGGGVAAKGFLGASLKLNKNIEYTVIRKNKRGPVPCGIPYAFGTLSDPNENIASDDALIEGGVKFIFDEVTNINRDKKELTLNTNDTVKYDKLIIATGSNPIVPPFEGRDLKGVNTIKKDLDIVVDMKEAVDNAKNIVIVGGGFIGVELADEINKLKNKNITLVEFAPHCLSVAFESDISEEIEASLREKNIKVLTGVGAKSFSGNNKVEKAILSDGTELDADLVFMSIGAAPNIALAASCGLETDRKKGVIVNKFQKTSDDSIFSIGDCASKIDIFSGENSNVRLASVAAKEGRNAALNLLKEKYELLPIGISNLFSTAVEGKYYAAAGMTKAQCESAGYKVIETSYSSKNRHPGKLPNAKVIEGKFFFDAKTLLLLGTQIKAETDQIAETINAVGIAIQNKATAYDLYAYNYASHPMGTASPNKYLLHQASLNAIAKK